LILIDEPELGLHPFAIHQLAALLKSASTRVQVVVSTQSVTLMNQLEVSDLVVVDRKTEHGRGYSELRRVSEEEIAQWTSEYALGEIWEKNIIGGRPR
jgi:predicted ATPase